MLYHLIEWLNELNIKVPGEALFQFITSRVLMAVLLSLIISTLIGKKIINMLRKNQGGESVRDLGLQGEKEKKGTPTTGGNIIMQAIIIPTLLLADLNKAYLRLMLFATVWLGHVGFVDDYLKLKAKKKAQQNGEAYKKGDKDGLAGWFKVLGQVVLGVVVAATLLLNENTKVWREYLGEVKAGDTNIKSVTMNDKTTYFVEADEPITTIPFVKNHEFNYAKLLPAALKGFTWLLYTLIIIFIITAVSNGANITDGLDGLATGVSALIGVCLDRKASCRE